MADISPGRHRRRGPAGAMTEINSVNTGVGNLNAICIGTDGNVYAVNTGAPATVVRVDPASMLVTGILVLGAGENTGRDIISVGSKVYITLGTIPGGIARIDQPAFVEDAVLWLANDGNHDNCYGIDYLGSKLYVVARSGSRVCRIDIPVFLQDAEVALGEANPYYCSTYGPTDSLYVVCQDVFPNPEVLAHLTLAPFVEVAPLILIGPVHTRIGLVNDQLMIPYGMMNSFIDDVDIPTFTIVAAPFINVSPWHGGACGTDEWVYVAIGTAPSRFVQWNYVTNVLSPDLVKPAGINWDIDCCTDGVYLYGCTLSGHITQISI